MDPNQDWSTDENNKEIPAKIRVETGEEGGRNPGIFLQI